jgi:hypothetical protein
MTDLRGINAPEVESSGTGKIAGAIVVALLIGAGVAYAYETGMLFNAPAPKIMAAKEPTLAKPPGMETPAPATEPSPAPAQSEPAQPSPHATLTRPIRSARTRVHTAAAPQAAVLPATNSEVTPPLPAANTIAPPTTTPIPATPTPAEPVQAAPDAPPPPAP